jgi:hypothetical protein
VSHPQDSQPPIIEFAATKPRDPAPSVRPTAGAISSSAAHPAALEISAPILDRLLASQIVPREAKVAALRSCLAELDDTRFMDSQQNQLKTRLLAALKVLEAERPDSLAVLFPNAFDAPEPTAATR